MPDNPTVISDLESLPARIKAASEHVADAQAALTNARTTRDDLIVQGHDHAGLRLREIAAAADISVPQVIRILSRSSED